MRIAIIGAGNVGGGLGRAFAAVGHEVVFGVRDPESTKTLAALGDIPTATAASPAEAVAGADAIVFSVRPVGLATAVGGDRVACRPDRDRRHEPVRWRPAPIHCR